MSLMTPVRSTVRRSGGRLLTTERLGPLALAACILWLALLTVLYLRAAYEASFADGIVSAKPAISTMLGLFALVVIGMAVGLSGRPMVGRTYLLVLGGAAMLVVLALAIAGSGLALAVSAVPAVVSYRRRERAAARPA